MDANSEKKIKVLPNGPYEVIGDIPLNQLRYVNDRKGASTGYKEIQKYAPEGVYHLCRCGGSATGRIRKTALKEIRPPAMTHTMKCLSSTKGR